MYREFAGREPTVYAIAKVKTMAAVTGGKPTGIKRKLGEGSGVTVTLDAEDEDEAPGCSFLDYLIRLEVLGNVLDRCRR